MLDGLCFGFITEGEISCSTEVGREKVCDIINNIGVGGGEAGALHHEAAVLHHVEDHVGVDAERLVSQDVPLRVTEARHEWIGGKQSSYF